MTPERRSPPREAEDEDTLHRDLYMLLGNIRSAGNRDYYNLTSTYLVANSILLGAISVLIRGEPVPHIIVIGLSLFGLLLCLQMGISQGRFFGQNKYWERCLRLIENHPEWTGPKLFDDLHHFLEHDKHFPEENGVPDTELKPGFAIRHHKKWWASRRMRILPWLFATIFLGFITWTIIDLI